MMKTKEEEGGRDMGAKEKRFPKAVKLMPFGPEAVLKLEAGEAKKKLTMSLVATSNSRNFKLVFDVRKPASEEPSGIGSVMLLGDGRVASYYLKDFGVYDEKAEYELKTPMEGVGLMIRRTERGDVSIWLKGVDLAETDSFPHKSREYVTIHRKEGKVVGYTFKDLFHNINYNFSEAVIEFQLD
jgi:hypothetical protein